MVTFNDQLWSLWNERRHLVETHDEWQVSDRRYLSDGSMALLDKPTETTKG